VATAFLALACATGDGAWVDRAGELLESVLTGSRPATAGSTTRPTTPRR
jgi:hypothetical protein